jgi:two-component system, cell cycle sensor histidine kinase and response regulator CckA
MNESSARILIADDEPALLNMMSVYLARLGYRVEACGTAGEARSRLSAEPSGFEAVVLDASMPGLSLAELARQALDGNPGLRVIAASGYPVDMSAVESSAPGRVAFLLKPFSPEMLASTVRRMLAGQEEV